MTSDRKLIVIQGGQTGVDRGAHKAALEVGFQVNGYMPADGKDELGYIPGNVASHLRRCPQRGYAARTRANLLLADALLVVVEDRVDPYRTPGTKFTLTEARARKQPRLLVDETFPVQDVATWFGSFATMSQPLHSLMVAGPRASRWDRGEAVAASFVRAIGTLPICAFDGHDWDDDRCTRCRGTRPRSERHA